MTMKFVSFLLIITLSSSLFAQEFTAEDRLRLVCQNFSSEFNRRVERVGTIAYTTCVENAEVKVITLVEDRGEVVLQDVTLQNFDFVNSFIQDVSVSYNAVLTKTIMYDATATRWESFMVAEQNIVVEDRRSPSIALRAIVQNADLGETGEYEFIEYDINQTTLADIEARAERIRTTRKEDVVTVIPGHGNIEFEYYTEELSSFLSLLAARDQILGTIHQSPSLSCSGEGCMWEAFYIYLTDGQILELYFSQDSY